MSPFQWLCGFILEAGILYILYLYTINQRISIVILMTKKLKGGITPIVYYQNYTKVIYHKVHYISCIEVANVVNWFILLKYFFPSAFLHLHFEHILQENMLALLVLDQMELKCLHVALQLTLSHQRCSSVQFIIYQLIKRSCCIFSVGIRIIYKLISLFIKRDFSNRRDFYFQKSKLQIVTSTLDMNILKFQYKMTNRD